MSEPLQKEYGALYRRVREIVNREDPIHLKQRIELEEEYDPEIAVILAHLGDCKSVDEVHRMIYQVFLQKFDPPVTGPPQRYRAMAERICKLTRPAER